MKKVILNYLVIAALAISAVVLSCENKMNDECETCQACENCDDCESGIKYSIVFISDGNVVDEFSVFERCILSIPILAPRAGFIFEGWYSNEKLSEEYDFTKPVSTNLTLYANWIVEYDCNGYDYDKIQLLEAIIRGDGSIYRMFEYDNQDRIERMVEYHEEGYEITSEFFYNGNDLVKIVSDNFYYMGNGEYFFEKDGYEVEFSKSEDKIIFTETYKYLPNDIVNTIMLNLDSDGFNIGLNPNMSMNGRSYTVVNGNLTNYLRWSFSSQGAGTQTENNFVYKYDNNKSPFYNCKTPTWYLIYYFLELGCQNNATEIVHTRNGFFGISETITKNKYIYNCAGYPIKRTETVDGKISDILEFRYK